MHCIAFMRHQYPGLLEGNMQNFHELISDEFCGSTET